MMPRHYTSLWKEITFQLRKNARIIFAATLLSLIIASLFGTFSGYQMNTVNRDKYPLASPPRLETVKPWTKNQAEFLKLKNVLRSILSPGISAVRINSDVNLIRRCLDYRECKGVSALRHYGTCALVGSSGILLNSSCGDDIDASDFVIRFNLSPQEGYTRDVGKKSSMMVLNTIMSLRIYEFLQGGGEGKLKEKDIQKANNTILFLPKSTTHHLQRGKSFEQMLRRQGLNVDVVMGVTAFHNDEMRRQAWDVLGKNHNSEDRPSTGLLLVEIAITFCDRIQVYGFYPFARDQQNRTVPYHYWDDVTSVNSVLKRKHTHNFAAEFEILRSLHNNGVIEHRIGHC